MTAHPAPLAAAAFGVLLAGPAAGTLLATARLWRIGGMHYALRSVLPHRPARGNSWSTT